MSWLSLRKKVPDQPSERNRIPGYTFSDEARDLILSGKAEPELHTLELHLRGADGALLLPECLKIVRLVISDCADAISLPNGLWAENLELDNCSGPIIIPGDVSISQLRIMNCSGMLELHTGIRSWSVKVDNCPQLVVFPERFHARRLEITNAGLHSLEDGVVITQEMFLENLPNLTRIPNMDLESLIINDCPKLVQLPEKLEVDLLDISGCTNIRLSESEIALALVKRLNLRDCTQITELPEWLYVEESIEVANAGLTELPSWLSHCQLLWKDVKIDERIAFRPESITGAEVLRESNSERQRVMLERMGYERFLSEVEPDESDADHDPGGERKLLSVILDKWETLRLLFVSCPSTGRHYLLQVPPALETCHAAAAWIAGFDDPDEYKPEVET